MKPSYTAVEYWLLSLLLTGAGTQLATPQPVAPQVTAVEPKAGLTTPGTKVVVYGTDFAPDAVVYFGGLAARETKFITPSRLEVLTPYFRPGPDKIQLTSGGTTVRSDITFTSIPSAVDADIDRSLSLADRGQSSEGIAILTAIAKNYTDYQVRAFAHYQIGEIYFAEGDWWRWAWGGIFLDSDKSGMAVQTCWRYRLQSDLSGYLLPVHNEPDQDLKLADWTVIKDVTQNPEPLFYRALIGARYGKLAKATEDSDFILTLEPANPSYRALAAYIAVLAGKKPQLQSFSSENIKDARALGLLGEAAFLSGDAESAHQFWAMGAKAYPRGASLAFLAAKKHLRFGQLKVATALLNECIAMAPTSDEAKEAKELLVKLENTNPELFPSDGQTKLRNFLTLS